MELHVCPWWLGFLIDNRFRRWLHNPEQILHGLVREGDTALDIGCGMGFFSLALARMVGTRGRVYAVDLQPQMLAQLRRRAQRQGLLHRITLHRSSAAGIGLNLQADFAMAFWMVHEVPAREAFLTEIAGRLKPGGRFLLVEPKGHVRGSVFQQTIVEAQSAGFRPVAHRAVRWSHAILLEVPHKS